MMKANVGGLDKVLRIPIGIALIVMAYMNVVGVWGYIGIVPLLTGLIGWCPIYPMLGISSCPMKNSS
jgi:hypothetical protein